MNILVLGGTGAMGLELVKLASQQNNQIYVTSRREHNSKKSNIHYLCGNAKDLAFITKVLEMNNYDVIVDFMAYSTNEFRDRYKLFLKAASQYIFLSSSRVYEDAEVITEATGRLLDTCKDETYLKTDEYALAKARQENLLIGAEQKSWTIIRPYITYNTERLQLGFLEKELWLNRALLDKTIVFSKDIGNKLTTLTYGKDVAKAMFSLIGNHDAYGQIYHIMQTEPMKWFEILDIYSACIEKNMGKRPKIVIEDDCERLAKVIGRQYQAKYDRLYNRVFNNEKICKICPELKNATEIAEGLRVCLEEFIKSGKSCKPDWRYEGYADRIANETTEISEIEGIKNKLRYLLARYTSYFENR